MLRWTLLAAVLLASSMVEAQARPIEALMRQAVELRRDGRDADALLLLQRAYRLDASPRVRAQIGFAEQALGRFAEAEVHLREALAAPDPWVIERRAIIDEALRVIATLRREARPTVTTTATTTTSATVAVSDDRRRVRRNLAWIATGGAVLGLGVGTAMLVVRNAAARRFNDPGCLYYQRTRGENCGDDLSQGQTAEAVSVTGFVLGGASLVAAVVLWATLPRTPAPARIALRCGPGPGELGLACGGAF